MLYVWLNLFKAKEKVKDRVWEKFVCGGLCDCLVNIIFFCGGYIGVGVVYGIWG